MKKLSLFLMFAALGIFSLGCEPQKSTSTVPADSDHTSTDGGEEKPAAPASEVEPEAKPEEKPAEEPAGETKPEDKPEDKPEETPAEEPK